MTTSEYFRKNTQRGKAYAEDGVDVEEEAAFSKFESLVCKKSYKNSFKIIIFLAKCVIIFVEK